MGYDEPGSDLWPESEWRGFLVDVLNWIAQKANFSYTLQAPSGTGSECTLPDDVGQRHNTSKDYAAQYNCGAQDVFDRNESHIYLGMYYITAERLDQGLFTIPFASDVGISVIGPIKSESQPGKIFVPFSLSMWLYTLLTVAVVTLTLTIVEHSYSFHAMPDPKLILDDRYYEKRAGGRVGLNADYRRQLETRAEDAEGLLTPKAFCKTMGMMMSTSFLTLSTHDLTRARTRSGRLVSTVFCIFAIIWISAYTANLAAILGSSDETQRLVNSVEEVAELQARGVLGPACVKAGTAYAEWLRVNEEDIDFIEVPGSDVDDLLRFVNRGLCDTIIDSLPFAEWMQGQPDFCEAQLVNIKEPLKWGPVDMGIGVRQDLPHVAQELSYWLSELRSCGQHVHNSPCYLHGNIWNLWELWILNQKCTALDVDISSDDDVEQLTEQNFMDIFFMVWISCVLVSGATLSGDEVRLRVRGLIHCGENRSIVDYILKEFPEVVEDDMVTVNGFMKAWIADSAVRAAVRPIVLQHFLSTDVATYRFMKETIRLAEYQTINLKERWNQESDDLADPRGSWGADPSETRDGSFGGGHFWLKTTPKRMSTKSLSALEVKSLVQEREQLDAILAQEATIVRRCIYETLHHNKNLRVSAVYKEHRGDMRRESARDLRHSVRNTHSLPSLRRYVHKGQVEQKQDLDEEEALTCRSPGSLGGGRSASAPTVEVTSLNGNNEAALDTPGTVL
mmetsp:Transcript_1939/g.5711  ORF Transcript_1939/g.5711 Transcript_1939/m.5711 type:complete len:733 (-) Transcript_1939:1908-4106(-)